MTDKQRFSSVWDAIEDTPQGAASMRARSTLMMNLAEVIRKQGMTQAQAAALFGVTQPRISDLMRGKVNLFSLDTLIVIWPRPLAWGLRSRFRCRKLHQ